MLYLILLLFISFSFSHCTLDRDIPIRSYIKQNLSKNNLDVNVHDQRDLARNLDNLLNKRIQNSIKRQLNP